MTKPEASLLVPCRLYYDGLHLRKGKQPLPVQRFELCSPGAHQPPWVQMKYPLLALSHLTNGASGAAQDPSGPLGLL
jgi:hypothetical protein